MGKSNIIDEQNFDKIWNIKLGDEDPDVLSLSLYVFVHSHCKQYIIKTNKKIFLKKANSSTNERY